MLRFAHVHLAVAVAVSVYLYVRACACVFACVHACIGLVLVWALTRIVQLAESRRSRHAVNLNGPTRIKAWG